MLIRPQERTQNREPQRRTKSTSAEISCALCAFLWPASSLQIKVHPAVFLVSCCASGIVPNQPKKSRRTQNHEPQRRTNEIFCALCAFLWPASSLPGRKLRTIRDFHSRRTLFRICHFCDLDAARLFKLIGSPNAPSVFKCVSTNFCNSGVDAVKTICASSPSPIFSWRMAWGFFPRNSRSHFRSSGVICRVGSICETRRKEWVRTRCIL